jgi:putative oxidoreductase
MSLDWGLLAARLIVGLALAAHGSQKLFGWFGGGGIKPTGGFFETLGFRPGAVFAVAAGSSEFLGGLLIALGLAGPVGPALVLATMLVAAVTVHLANGFWNSDSGWELPAINSAAVLAFAAGGFGSLSIDANLPSLAVLHQPNVVWSVLGLGAIGGVANLLIRRMPEKHG